MRRAAEVTLTILPTLLIGFGFGVACGLGWGLVGAGAMLAIDAYMPDRPEGR